MCRSQLHGSRRCPCDTSEARNHRRVAARLARERRLALVPGSGSGSGSAAEETEADLDEGRTDLLDEQAEGTAQPAASSQVSEDSTTEMLGSTTAGGDGPAESGSREADLQVEERSDAVPTEAPGSALSDEVASVRALLADPSVAVGERVRRVAALGALMASEASALVESEAPVQAELVRLGLLKSSLLVERNAVVKKINKAGYGSQKRAELWPRYEELQAQFDEAAAAIEALHEPIREQGRAHLQQMAAAYREVLGRVREMGGRCTNLSAEGVDKDSLQILDEGLDVYPSDWVRRSNEHAVPVRVTKTQGRAHYISRKVTETKSRVRTSTITGFIKGYDPNPEDSTPYEEYIRWDDLDPDIKAAEFPGQFSPHPNNEYWVRYEYEVFDPWNYASKDGKPVGAGWRQERVYWPRNRHQADEDGMVAVWRRAKTQMRTNSAYASAVLTVDRAESMVGPAGQATARHEFAHRVQDTHRALTELEHEFIRQRTTDEHGVREPLQKYHGRSRERVRPDGFADQYMGKDYGDGTYHEVLSCAMEALFNGEHGGLVGVGTYKEDLPTRDFVLGLLAAA